MLKQITILIIFSFIVVGCQQDIKKAIQPIINISESIQQKVEEEQKKQGSMSLAVIKCQELCYDVISTNGKDFNVGPCLSNEIVPDWVCDIAHSPRQDIDDDPANQCDAYRRGQAKHYVELDGNCTKIKAR